MIVAGRAPSEARGRAFAMLGAAVQGAGMLGLLAAGPLVDRFEPRLLVAAAGAAGLLAVLACLPMVRWWAGERRRCDLIHVAREAVRPRDSVKR